ncbi:alpha/beta hydrolase [Nonomuraea sp. NPDC004702]
MEHSAGLERARPSHTKTASFVWLGYEAPQLHAGILRADTSVASPDLAQVGAGSLVGFLDGLHATRQPAGTPRFTVLGPSYGRVVAGMPRSRGKGCWLDNSFLWVVPGQWRRERAIPESNRSKPAIYPKTPSPTSGMFHSAAAGIPPRA